jgi:hypothetical protein
MLFVCLHLRSNTKAKNIEFSFNLCQYMHASLCSLIDNIVRKKVNYNRQLCICNY